ncbi:MAG TPA: hypothetical protein VE093_20675 [Polyangiaceae bacterium]|jgi:hypothetical protein|nr:hypothetical protein [Polyangiaceae bacterium]
MRTLWISVCAASAIALFAPALAEAQPPVGDKETARALAERGFELLEQGEPEKAIVSFNMAERRFHSPVHQLFIGRAETKLGRFVEAIHTYETLVAEKFPANAPKPFLDAQEEAKKELEALKARTPSIKVVIAGVPPAQAKVMIDEVILPPGEIGVVKRMNPGKHTIVATAPDAGEVEKTVTLAEGTAVHTVELSLETRGVSIPAVVAFSLGGVGLVVGAATGVAYIGKETSNQMLGAISLAGFITGGVGIVTGTLIIALSSSDGEPASAAPRASRGPALYAGVGPSSIVLGGRF